MWAGRRTGSGKTCREDVGAAPITPRICGTDFAVGRLEISFSTTRVRLWELPLCPSWCMEIAAPIYKINIHAIISINCFIIIKSRIVILQLICTYLEITIKLL